MENILFQEVQYQVEKTRWGVWRRHVLPTGSYFAEFRSHAVFLGLPLIHYTRGKNPQTGKRVVAKGIIAVGRLAVGFLALGQASLGLIALGQLAVGILFGLGQASTGLAAVGQAALALSFAAGQLAMGSTALGQIALGDYVLAQIGFGDHVWSTSQADPEAQAHFHHLFNQVRGFLGR